jgi:hypothetical protein
MGLSHALIRWEPRSVLVPGPRRIHWPLNKRLSYKSLKLLICTHRKFKFLQICNLAVDSGTPHCLRFDYLLFLFLHASFKGTQAWDNFEFFWPNSNPYMPFVNLRKKILLLFLQFFARILMFEHFRSDWAYAEPNFFWEISKIFFSKSSLWSY